MSNYPVPPPAYGTSGPSKSNRSENEAREPLLASSSRGNGIYDQPAQDDLPDDFKVRNCACSIGCLWILNLNIDLIVWSFSL